MVLVRAHYSRVFIGINPIDEGNIQIPDKQDIGVVLSETGFSEFFTVSI